MPTTWSCLRAGIDAFVRRFPLLLGAWLVILAAQQLVNLVFPDEWSWIGLLVLTVFFAPLYAGQHFLALRAVRNEPAAFRDLFRGYARWGTLVAASFLVSVLVTVGTILLIIPGIVWALTYVFAPIAVLDQRSKDGVSPPRIGAIDAMQRSKELTQGYRGVLFRIGLLLSLPAIVVVTLATVKALVPEIPIPPWAIQLFLLLSGTLFLGPVHATSYMVAYDAITRLKGSAYVPDDSAHETRSTTSMSTTRCAISAKRTPPRRSPRCSGC